MTTTARINYDALSATARDTIKSGFYWMPDTGALTIAGYVRHVFPDGHWHGDVCGCHDDRCVGYHHDADEDCGCLPVLLEEYAATVRWPPRTARP